MSQTCFLLLLTALSFSPSGANAQDTRTVVEPKIPPFSATLTARLKEVDESKPDTQRIQQALDHAKPGQAVVLRPDGDRSAFLTGPLSLRAGVTLVIDRGAILFGSRNPRDYDLDPGVCGTITEHGHGCKAMINGDHVAGAGVMGEGVIDGRGGAKIMGAKIMGEDITWWDLAEKARKGGIQNNPRILILSHCDNFTLYKIQLKDSPNFHVSYSNGNGFTAWGVIVNCPRNARNTDGIDPGNSSNVTITRCFIHTGDDQVAIKAGEGAPTTHMTIAHNHFYTGHGMSIGSGTAGGASAIRVSDLSVDGADNALRIKSNDTLGGPVHDIEYDDVCIRNTRNPIFMDTHYTASHGKTQDKIPAFTDIRLKNVSVLGGGKVTLVGYDATHRLGIQFDNVHLDHPESIKMPAAHADIQLGPGPTNFQPAGDDVNLTGQPGRGQPGACTEKFVPFPVPISTKQ